MNPGNKIIIYNVDVLPCGAMRVYTDDPQGTESTELIQTITGLVNWANKISAYLDIIPVFRFTESKV